MVRIISLPSDGVHLAFISTNGFEINILWILGKMMELRLGWVMYKLLLTDVFDQDVLLLLWLEVLELIGVEVREGSEDGLLLFVDDIVWEGGVG